MGKLVVIVGETATGKSGLAMGVAQEFEGEIVNADSWQIYRYMDIGTSKPSKSDQQKIKHHLIDIVDPDENFTAAIYKELAEEAIESITRRNHLPVLVGGTGLYVDSVLFNYSFAPEGDPTMRYELNKTSLPNLLNMVESKGLDLTGIDIRNKRRLIRLIETGGVKPTRTGLRQNTLVVGLKSESRAALRRNIEARVEQMFRQGLKHEVSELASRYGWDVESMKGIGYREFRPYFEEEQSLRETKRRIVKSTLDLAKRQRTWLKKNRHILWFDNRQTAIDQVSSFLSKV